MTESTTEDLVAQLKDDPLSVQLRRNARFYEREAAALAESPERRDRRCLGDNEAGAIADYLNKAADRIEELEDAKR